MAGKFVTRLDFFSPLWSPCAGIPIGCVLLTKKHLIGVPILLSDREAGCTTPWTESTVHSTTVNAAWTTWEGTTTTISSAIHTAMMRQIRPVRWCGRQRDRCHLRWHTLRDATKRGLQRTVERVPCPACVGATPIRRLLRDTQFHTVVQALTWLCRYQSFGFQQPMVTGINSFCMERYSPGIYDTVMHNELVAWMTYR